MAEETSLDMASPSLALNGGHDELSKRERQDHDHQSGNSPGDDERPFKRAKTDDIGEARQPSAESKPREKVKGVALIKEEYLIKVVPGQPGFVRDDIDDDAAEGRREPDAGDSRDRRTGHDGAKGGRKKQKGQNKDRDFGSSHDAMRLCNSRVYTPEFSPKECPFGERCNSLHDLRKYLKEGRRGDVETLGGKCHVFEICGRCPSGWRCRFLSSHMKEIEREDGRKELHLVEKGDRTGNDGVGDDENDDTRPGIFNVVSADTKRNLTRKKVTLEKSDQHLQWLDHELGLVKKHHARKKGDEESEQDYRAAFVDPPLRPSEKRKIYFGRETPVLAPLTTQGNLPFRRLCVELGAQGTYSEMAMAMELLTGKRSEWALLKAHESELASPRVNPDSIVTEYDNSKDLIFGAQISANAPWVAARATEAMSRFLPHLRLIDMNCGCPLELVYQKGAGSALLDSPSKLERIIRAMNTVSGEIPITAKLRTGIKDGYATAQRNIERLAFGGPDTANRLGAPGCAAITLHGRSRQQRYRKPANWSYIAECATLIKSYTTKKDDLADTIREPDENTQANTLDSKLYFLGNGDCYSHVDYFDHVDNAGVDTVMIGRGALVKPWIFEEIEKGQYLDKSATERLGYVEKFARYGMEVWGSDEVGLGTTRRFMLEYLNFANRYIPVGILDHLPPSLNDRPPAFRGRNDLETLLSSGNYKDWIKISEMFLGPAHPEFRYEPKHKSKSYEVEAEG